MASVLGVFFGRKFILIGYLTTITLIELILWIIRVKFMSPHAGSKVRRIQVLVMLEFVMSLGSCLIWFRCCQLRSFSVRKKSVSVVEAIRMISTNDVIDSGLILFLFFTHSCLVSFYVLLSEEPHLLALIAFICKGAFVYLSVFLLAFSAWELLILLVCKHFAGWHLLPNHPRLKALILGSRCHTVISLVLTLVFTGVGLHAGFSAPTVHYQKIYLNKLPGAFDGFSITLLTDVHIGPTVGRRRVEEAVDIVNSLKPDVVAIAGDLVDGSVQNLYLAADPLKHLKAKYGVYFSTGNHEYYYGDVNDWLKHLETLGIQPLHNSHVKIVHPQVPSASFCFGGVDDYFAEKSGVPGHHMDLASALSGCNRRKLVIMMVHQPNGAKKLLDGPEGYAVDLILSGHTHGGQLYVLVPLTYLSQAYYYGLYRHDSGAQVYVSSGLNFFGPPLKMYGFREITHITLHRA